MRIKVTISFMLPHDFTDFSMKMCAEIRLNKRAVQQQSC